MKKSIHLISSLQLEIMALPQRGNSITGNVPMKP